MDRSQTWWPSAITCINCEKEEDIEVDLHTNGRIYVCPECGERYILNRRKAQLEPKDDE